MDASDLGYLIKRVQQAFRSAIDVRLADLGLTMAQYATLYNLRRHPGASNAELARLSFVTPQTMVRIVVGLEERGLLRRVASPDHARIFQAHLSDEGNGVLGQAQRRVGLIHAHALEGMSGAETERLIGSLTRIATRLEESDTRSGSASNPDSQPHLPTSDSERGP
jgi:DNA-binding MarR family transcriptional regulator